MRRALLALVPLLALAGSEARAFASDDPTALQLVVGIGAAKTEWRGDADAHGSLKVGVRPNRYFAAYFLGRLGYGSVDDRMLTLVSLGVQIWPAGQVAGVEPYLRLSIAHQHEETLFVVKDDPFGALFGIGDGLRHRGGFEGAAGLDIPFDKFGATEAFVSLEASTIWFYDPRGPNWYVSANTGIGINYDL